MRCWCAKGVCKNLGVRGIRSAALARKAYWLPFWSALRVVCRFRAYGTDGLLVRGDSPDYVLEIGIWS